ncbi:MAG: hypothetical protein ACYTFI_05430 [Planctomycetota bacterium]
MASALVLFVSLCGSGVSYCGEKGTLPDPGPASHGLRLRLIVTNPKPGEEEVHRIRLEVLNVGKAPVVLVAKFVYERGGDYAAYLRSAATFTTVPEVLSYTGQTAGRSRKSPQPEARIEPRGSLVSEWEIKGRMFHSGGWELTIPTDGQFLIRAHVTVKTKAGEHVRLWSNEQPFVVGGVDTAPRQCVAKIWWVQREMNSVHLDVGAVDGASVGDVFRTYVPMRGRWDLEVTSVDRERSVASVLKHSYYEDNRRIADVPGKDTKAALVPDDKQ